MFSGPIDFNFKREIARFDRMEVAGTRQSNVFIHVKKKYKTCTCNCDSKLKISEVKELFLNVLLNNIHVQIQHRINRYVCKFCY